MVNNSNDDPERDIALLNAVVDVWKTTVGVQQHFNDLELRIRNYAVTMLVAVLSGAGLAVKENVPVAILGFTTSLGTWIIIAGLVGWLAFYMMDRWWYHRLLIGSVEAGEAIEDRWKDILPEIELTKAISRASPFNFMGANVRSRNRLDLFYLIIAAMLVVVAFAVHFSITGMPATPAG